MKKIKIKIIAIIIAFLFLFSGISISQSVTKIENNKENLLRSKNLIESSNIDIIYPRCSNPVIVEKNSNFTVSFKSDEYENIYFYISTAYEPIVDEYELEVIDSWKENNINYVNLKIPNEINEELYNLTIIELIDDRFYYKTRPRSVNIIDNFSDDFSFIHITDFHVGDPRGFLESIRETIGYKSIKRCIKEINLLNPDFVIISGDLVFGQLYYKEYTREYKICYDMIQMFDVPTFIVPGNHDGYRRIGEDGLEMWKEYFGSLYFSFDYGNYHFQGINSYDWPEKYRWSIGPLALTWGGYIKDDQLDWIENDLEYNNDSNLTFMFMHHNPIWNTNKDTLINKGYYNREKLLDLIDSYDVNMVLSGHVHFDDVTIQNDTIFITTTTPESKIEFQDGYWGYRLVQIENGKIISYNYKEPKYSIPSYQIDIENINDYSKKVTNNLDKDISVQLKFTIPKRSYIVQNAEIEMTRENKIYREYYLNSIVEPKDEKIVSLNWIN